MGPADTYRGKLRFNGVLRPNLLAITLATAAASGMCLLPNFPFHNGFCVVAAVSALLHFTAFAGFYYLETYPVVLEGMVVVNLAMLGFIIHFTGGLMSPFVFFYFWILASAIIYGVKDRISTWVAMGSYAAVILAEVFGLLRPYGCASNDVYASKVVTFMVLASILMFIMMTRYITTLVLENLRGSLERENAEKNGLLKKFSELDASAQIGALAHRIAHDLRGPLSSISGYVQTEMLKTQPAETMAELCDLNDTVENMVESLRGITRFGKQATAQAERIQLSEFFRQLLAIAAFSPQARGAKFVKHYQEHLDLWVKAHRADLQQAFFNLIKNALEATEDNAEGRVIEVSILKQDGEAEVRLADNGPGMDPEALKNLFRKSVTTKKDGTGVGLVITRDLLARNDGYIEFRNRRGGGLEVSVRMPAA